jgi:thiamine-phosphate pyrophosphorylase
MQSSFRLPRVYPLTDVQLTGLSHAHQVRLLSLGGATLVQLREKQMPALQFYEQARAAVSAASDLQLIINDRVDVALAVGADGVHLGQDDMPPEAARRLLGDDAVIGYSTHSVEQAKNAVTLPIDYIAIGPIFTTSSKTNPSPTLGLEGLHAVREAIGNVQLVAIGGISHSNARELIAAGADSVAVLSALLYDPAEMSHATHALSSSLV